MDPREYRIGIVGARGYVGSAMTKFFQRRFEQILTSDLDCKVHPHLLAGCNLVCVCVPTQQRKDGRCDTAIVEQVVNEIVDAVPDGSEAPSFLIKSTVPPGYCYQLAERLRVPIVFSPEYIGESKYHSEFGFETDVAATPWFIFGAAPHSRRAAEEIADVFAYIAGPSKQYMLTDSTTAEVVKYWENVYFATKVTFANEMRKVCESHGVSFHEARELWALDPRVEPMHTMAFKHAPGFGGKCFPKDLSALIAATQDAGYTPKFLQAVQSANERFRNE